MPGRANPPLVSALITNWNYGRFLREAVDSALGQSYPRLEVIVVDDGSTDDSREILAGYGDRIRTILKANGGPTSAANAGLAAARGEIVCFLDSDDTWLHDKVAAVVDAFRSRDVGIVMHDLMLQDEHGAPVRGSTWCQAFHVTLRQGDLLPWLKETAFEWAFSPSSGLAASGDLLQRIGPIPSGWADGVDSCIANAAACLRPVGVIDRPLGSYRLHGRNRSQSGAWTDWHYKWENLVKRPRRIALARSVLARQGLELELDPLQHYPFLRDWCFITRRLPVVWLPRLWRTNLSYRRRQRVRFGSLVRSLAGDTREAILISLGLSPRYRDYRRRWRSLAGRAAPGSSAE